MRYLRAGVGEARRRREKDGPAEEVEALGDEEERLLAAEEGSASARDVGSRGVPALGVSERREGERRTDSEMEVKEKSSSFFM